jgi:hypothetical protein
VLPQAVSEHYRSQQRLIVATLGLTRAEWSRMGADFDASWARVGPRILLLTASAQLGAARSGAAYVPDTLAELGTPVDPVGEVVPEAFSGVASDGRPLDTLLGESVIRAKVARDNGAAASDALTAAGRALDLYVHTQVADAARGAASVAIAARPTVGWVRMVNPPCCGRCAVLAGKWFGGTTRGSNVTRAATAGMCPPRRTSRGCWHVAAALFDGGHVKGLTSGQAKAISEGADPGRVINATRKASGMTTTEAAVRGPPRLTPDGIYRMATTVRARCSSYAARLPP